jgi:hypothetical protein
MGAIEDLKPIEAAGTDFGEFEGTKAKIEAVDVISVKSDYAEDGTYQKGLQREVKVVRVATEKITEIQTVDGAKPVMASEMFNLRKDVDGSLGWSKSPKAKLHKFLKKMKVDAPKELMGKSVVLRVRVKENPDGTTKEFLGFNTD